MPGRGTIHHSVRVEPDLWDEAKAIAESRGEDLSAIIRACLRRYVKRHRRKD